MLITAERDGHFGLRAKPAARISGPLIFFAVSRFVPSGAEQWEDSGNGEAEDKAGDVGDDVARVTGSARDKRLKPLHCYAIAQQCEDGDRREFAIGCLAQTQHRSGQYRKNYGVQHKVTYALHPAQRRVTDKRKRVGRQQRPRYGGALQQTQQQMSNIPKAACG